MSKKSRPTELKLQGKLLAFNMSPKGHIEGALIETGAGLAQLNFPKHTAEGTVRALSVGSTIDVAAELESEHGDHPVYRAVDEEAQASGTIFRLNYALHGEVNGCHLDDGTFVHVKPGGAKKYKLRVGDKISATGSRRSGIDAVVLEATSVVKLAAGKKASASS
jgi:hypothetical protein